MVSAVMKMVFAAVALVVIALSGGGARVSAQTHHVVGGGGGDNGWGPAFNVSSWLSGRVFKVGDKIWFNYSGTEDSIVELQNMEEFVSCNFTNPIRMYTDPTTHVSLDEEGVRYFASGNLESCKNGLKLPVPIQPSSDSGPHHEPSPDFDPSEHFEPAPEVDPSEHFEPTPEFGPPEPVEPFGPPEHEFGPPPPLPIPTPAAATHLNGLSVVLIAGLLSYYIGCHFY